MTKLKTLGVLLDAAMIMLVVFMVVFLFVMANDMAKENEKHWPPPGGIPENVYERLLNGDGQWE